MRNKNTAWTAEEEAALVEAVRDKISPARLSVRFKRSEAAIKRRIRELGLAGTKRGPRRAAESAIRISLDPVLQIERWLEACRVGDLVAAMNFYAPEATLECACTGPAVYVGVGAIQEYWASKLRSDAPRRFSLTSARVEDGRVVVDYLSYQALPVRMYASFDEAGRIIRSQCAPGGCNTLAA